MASNQIIDRDLGYDDIVDALDDIDGSEIAVFVGFRALSAGADVIAKAAANEFGTETIPERSFMRSTVDEEQRVYLDHLERAAGEFADGRQGRAVQTLERLGLRAVGDIQEKIVELRDPPNAPSTIASKGSSNPLIDTGNMRQSVDYLVVLDGVVI